MPEIGFFGDHRCSLGESPIWDSDAGCLWWADAREMRICAAEADGTPRESWTYDQMIGSVALAEDGLLAALADGFYAIDGRHGKASPLALVPGHDGKVRLNDGKLDRGGRFLCAQAEMAEGATGSLWQLDWQGTVREIERGIRIGNAICFSPDGGTLYFADSLDGVIRVHAYDRATGKVGERKGEIDVRPFGQAPDGATVDADGNLWIALVLDQAIAQVRPDGTVLQRIDVPIPLPSCPAFGGPMLDTLYVTSISNSGRRLSTDHADGGRILTIRGTGARGVAEGRFGGRPQ